MTGIDDIVAALRSGLCVQKTLGDGTGVVLDLDSSRFLALNATGMFLVDEMTKGADSVDDLVDALTSGFEVDRTTAEADIRELLDQLGQLLTGSPPAAR